MAFVSRKQTILPSRKYLRVKTSHVKHVSEITRINNGNVYIICEHSENLYTVNFSTFTVYLIIHTPIYTVYTHTYTIHTPIYFTHPSIYTVTHTHIHTHILHIHTCKIHTQSHIYTIYIYTQLHHTQLHTHVHNSIFFIPYSYTCPALAEGV